MFGPKEGTYELSSESDPRWNKSWRGVDYVTNCNHALHEKVEEMKTELGEPPKDLYAGFFKD